MPEPTKPLLTKLANGIKNWFKKSAEPRPYKLDVSILEDRILYSATAMPMPDAAPMDLSSLDIDAIEAAVESALSESADTTALQAAFAAPNQSPQEDSASNVDTAIVSPTNGTDQGEMVAITSQADVTAADLTLDAIDSLLTELQYQLYDPSEPQFESSLGLPIESSDSLQDSSSLPRLHEVVFIQSSLFDISGLIDDIESEALLRGSQLDVYVMDRLSDGFAQIDDILAQYDDLGAIHIVSHGTNGMIQLGGSWLTVGNVDQHLGDLQRWGMALNDSGDILIYGCDVAQGIDGEMLIEAIADATHADVAASTDSTGNAARGGNWTLEIQTGQIDTPIAFGIQLQESYGGLLATYTVTNTNDTGAGSLRQAILDANANSGIDTITFNISGAGTHSINLASALPVITEGVLIDGWSEPDYVAGNLLPVIELNGNATTGANGFHITASNVTIRGFTINRFDGIAIYIGSGSSNTIQGNYIGTNAAGTALAEVAGAGSGGIEIRGGSNTIGGTTAQQRNIIAGMQDAIRLTTVSATNNIIRGNYIGTGVTGTEVLGNTDDGVDIGGSASNNAIGGTGTTDGNLIVNNSGRGIEVRSDSGNGNSFLGNLIYSNSALGIDLNADGVTTNDTGDGDTGPNARQNFPVLHNAYTDGSSVLAINGTFNSTASRTFRLEFFASTLGDGTGYGEGQTYLGFVNVTTNGSGNAFYGTSFSRTIASGTIISATATDLTTNSTSEFGFNMVANSNLVYVTTTNDASNGTVSSIAALVANDGGDGISLREAIAASNNTAGADTIAFSIGSGVQTITLSSLLPSITSQVTIDGTTQGGYSGAPLIVITGGGTVSDGFQLYTGSDNSTIKGLVIRSFTQDGIDIASSNGNSIIGNYIGIAQTGLSSSGNQQGVNIWAASNNIIGGSTAAERNIISGNSGYGVWIGGGGTGNQVRGNYIGTNYMGTGSLQNGNVGVYIDSANNTVGGTTSGYGNLISGNTSTTGLSLTSLATGSVVQGNIIGLSTSGTALANSVGINVSASNVTIGGTTAAARNVISGNTGVGIDVYGTGNTIQGNYVGVDTTGLTKVANGSYGIDMHTAATNTTIGGAATGARNIISGNGNAGILFETGSSGSVLGNYIGVDATGATSIAGNGAAIFIATSNVKVGGVNAGEGNIISGSNTDGIIVTGSVSGNSFLSNSIWGNSGQAIDLNDDGININDFNDTDTGVNGLQNFPRLNSATSSGGNTTIIGAINTTANVTYRVEFFSNAFGAADASGYGEATTYLGSTTVTTDASGNAQFSATLNGVTLSSGATVTATATVDLGGGSFGATSEFAGNILANHSNLMITGTYTGNATDNRTISGLGFRPEAIMILPESASQGVLRTSSMSGDVSKILNYTAGGLQANLIQSLTGDGFTIGTHASVNTNAVVYHWIAWGAGADITVGSYSGNGTSQSINGIGFQADMMLVAGASTSQAAMRSSVSTSTFDFGASTGVTTAVTTLGSDGFSIGASALANSTSTVYHYVAFNQNSNYFSLGSYTGNATDNRNITGVGFEPEFVFTKKLSAGDFAGFKTESSGYATDKGLFADGFAAAANYIQALQSDGFQVGTGNEVNTSGASYGYFAFRQNDAPLIVDTTSDTSDGTVTSINNLRASRGADGKISLREAIAATNATRNVNGTPNEIDFGISGSGVQTITIGTTGLAAITDAVVIDAWTQSGWNNSPLIELNGNNTGTTLKDGFNLASGSSGSTIRGFHHQPLYRRWH